MHGPRIVPTLQTKGMTEKARAAIVYKQGYTLGASGKCVLTFVLGFRDKFANHGLDDTDIAV